ncbi:MAG TPA: Snf7 family protein [Candidatus Lokiarchaeia archaeon]|nr:Snf7 family protein [Candidatus Lokiarchaeia archaeon]
MPLFKKKSVSKDQAFLDLKDSMKKIDGSIKKKEQMVGDLKKKAMIALQQKNEKLAKIHLAKKIKQEKDIEGLYGIQRKLSDQMDAIDQAETVETATKALSAAVSILNQYAKVIDNLNVESIMADSEESIGIINDAADMMGDTSQEAEIDNAVSQEFEELQAEVALDAGTKLPTTEGGIDTTSPEQLEQETIKADAEDVKRELEKLKKELDMG